jgi:hypothetical protein
VGPRALVLAIAVVAMSCDDGAREKRVQTPGDLAQLGPVQGINGSLILDGIDVDELALPQLRTVTADLWIKVSPKTRRIDLPLLRSIAGVFVVYSDAPRSSSLELRVPALTQVGGFIQLRELGELTATFFALTRAGGMYLGALDRSTVELPLLVELTGAIDIQRVRGADIELPRVPRANTFVALDVEDSTLIFSALESVRDEMHVDDLRSTFVDLSAIEGAGKGFALGTPPARNDPMRTATIVSSTIALGPIAEQGLEVLLADSVLEVSSPAIDSLYVRAEHARVELTGVRTVAQSMVFVGPMEVSAPVLESAQGLSSYGARLDFPELRTLDRLIVNNAPGDELSFLALESVGQEIELEDLQVVRVAFPALASIGKTGTNGCKDGLQMLRNALVEELDLSALTEVRGDFWVQFNRRLPQCRVLDQLEGVTLLDPSCEVLVLDNRRDCP